ncbi:hypothetical protein K491DRAFT_387747 [Lophiostoma macrostomum CBS 122681]|uniref:Homeobox domain-containing protein n=1 Tax=Lophiostoma macrostomum CBS 122681 TaxID=1314788 RepID=A0A6A6TSE2_9PLEO|nr:hypothetical protein K491DRAFT_387747 [Lophiostoma macrostomum CBS 122681]
MEDTLNDDVLRLFMEDYPTAGIDLPFEHTVNEGAFGTLDTEPLYSSQFSSRMPYEDPLQGTTALFHSPLEQNGRYASLESSPSNLFTTPFLEASWDDLTGEPFSPDFLELSPQTSNHSLGSDRVQAVPTSVIAHTDRSRDEEEESGGSARKKRRRIPSSARKVLDATFERLKEDPYVPQDELRALEERTGLSPKQIRTFFANARARKLPKAISYAVDPNAVDKQQDPMQRFLSSSPEDEGIPEDAIRNAVGTTGASWPSPAAALQQSPKRAVDTVSVSGSAFSSNSGSSSSQASADSANSRGSRRGRKRRREPTDKIEESFVRHPSEPSKIYQCTFCATDFSQKYDWKRHEESVHFPQTEWICMPNGPVYDTGGGKRCSLCDSEYPDDAHLETHNCQACTTTPQEQHSFMRKDKLVQHLLQVHRCKPPPSIKTWSRPVSRTCTMICGICGHLPLSWTARIDHYASHFTSGHSMALWLLGRPGGILPQVSPSEEWIQRKMKIEPHPEGDYHCPDCSNRFVITQAMFHKRQAHSDFTDVDYGLKFLIANLSRQVLDGKQPQLPPKESTEMGFGTKLWLQNNTRLMGCGDRDTKRGSTSTLRPTVNVEVPMAKRIPFGSALGRMPARGFSETSHASNQNSPHLEAVKLPAMCTHIYPYRSFKATSLGTQIGTSDSHSASADDQDQDHNANLSRLYPFFPFDKQAGAGGGGGRGKAKKKEKPVVLAHGDGKPVKMLWNSPGLSAASGPVAGKDAGGGNGKKVKQGTATADGQDAWVLRRDFEGELS